MESYNENCMFCEDILEKTHEEELEDGSSEIGYYCSNCKTEYMVRVLPDEEKQDYPFYNKDLTDTIPNEYHGYGGKCPICGHYVYWSADFMLSEMEGVDLPEEEDSVVGVCSCPHCGSSIDIIYPSELVLREFENAEEVK